MPPTQTDLQENIYAIDDNVNIAKNTISPNKSNYSISNKNKIRNSKKGKLAGLFIAVLSGTAYRDVTNLRSPLNK